MLFVLFSSEQVFSKQLSLRNAMLIPFALESATNVSRNENTIKTMYSNTKNGFPKKGDLIELSDTFLLSMINYGSEFCFYMIQSDMKKNPADRWAHADIDFNIPPSNWNEVSRKKLFERYSELFWQRGLTSEEEKIISEEFSDLLIDMPNSNQSGLGVLMGTCGVYTASPSFVFVGGL